MPGGVELTMDVSGTVEIVSWVLGFGNQAEVLEPQALRDPVAAELGRAAARYAGSKQRRRCAQKSWNFESKKELLVRKWRASHPSARSGARSTRSSACASSGYCTSATSASGPSAVQRRARRSSIKGNHEDLVWLDAQHGPEVLPRLFYLRNGRTMKLGEGRDVVRVSGVGGCYGPADFDRPSKLLQGYAKRHYTRDEIDALYRGGARVLQDAQAVAARFATTASPDRHMSIW